MGRWGVFCEFKVSVPLGIDVCQKSVNMVTIGSMFDLFSACFYYSVLCSIVIY